MKRYIAIILIVGLLSIATSLLYGFRLWFTFDFMGPEQGSERTSVGIWTVINLLLGLFVCALSIDQLRRMSDFSMKLLLACVNAIVFIHIAPLCLWLAFAAYDERLRGISLHLVVCLLSLVSIYALLRAMNRARGG